MKRSLVIALLTLLLGGSLFFLMRTTTNQPTPPVCNQSLDQCFKKWGKKKIQISGRVTDEIVQHALPTESQDYPMVNYIKCSDGIRVALSKTPIFGDPEGWVRLTGTIVEFTFGGPNTKPGEEIVDYQFLVEEATSLMPGERPRW